MAEPTAEPIMELAIVPIRTIRTVRRPLGSWHPNKLLIYYLLHGSTVSILVRALRYSPASRRSLVSNCNILDIRFSNTRAIATSYFFNHFYSLSGLLYVNILSTVNS